MKTVYALSAALLIACSKDSSGPQQQPPVLDQQNLFEGTIAAQSVGMFNDSTGAADGSDQQSAQTFTVAISGHLAEIKVPLINTQNATIGVTMDLLRTAAGVPDDGRKLGEVSVPISALPTSTANRTNPDSWVAFDFTNQDIEVTAGEQLAFVVRTRSTIPILFNAEQNFGYVQGRAYRRNRTATTVWSQRTYSHAFQTYVRRN